MSKIKGSGGTFSFHLNNQEVEAIEPLIGKQEISVAIWCKQAVLYAIQNGLRFSVPKRVKLIELQSLVMAAEKENTDAQTK